MNWKNYSHLRNSHAFLSASRHHWLNYDEEKLVQTYLNHQKTKLGTEYHNLAADLIKLAVRLPDTEDSFNAFVNDAIGFRMDPEVLLYFSPNAYGTADAISFHDSVLRIHDLKTGLSPASINQPLIYAALFALDYQEAPTQTVLRIYQNNEIVEYEPEGAEIRDVCDKIIGFDKLIEHTKAQAIF